MHDARNDRRNHQQPRPQGTPQQQPRQQSPGQPPRQRGLTVRRQRLMVDLAPAQDWLGCQLCRLTWSAVAAGLTVALVPLPMPGVAFAALALVAYGTVTAVSLAFFRS
jgi:hypothetical protein